MGFLRLLSPFMLKMGLGLFVVSVAAGAPPPSTAWDDLPTVKPADDDWPWWRGPNRDNIAFSRLAAGSSWLPGTIWAMAALPRQ
jgi:hypothetical protein